MTLTGTYRNTVTGDPGVGYVFIVPSVPAILDLAGNVVLAGPARVDLDAAGSFSVDLPATDDPGLSHQGFGYTLLVKLSHTSLAPFSFQLPANPAVVDVTDVAPVAVDGGVAVTRGLSAYEVAVANGFVGSEAAWLASLVPSGFATTADVAAAVADRPTTTVMQDAIAASETSTLTAVADSYGLDATRSTAADGVTDDTAVLNELLASAAAFGATVLLGKHAITGPLVVPDGVTIRGRDDDARLILPDGAAFAAVDIDGKARVTVRDLRVTSAGATAIGAAAVSVRGDSTDIHIDGVYAESLYEGFRVEGKIGTVPGVCERVVLSRCVSTDATQYGFRVDECDGLELAHCSSVVSGLDGIKLRRMTRNVVITGGYYTGATGGDGIDAYAGGDTFTIQGTVFSGNGFNGVVIKNDDLNLSDPANYGYVRNITLSGLICNDNGGSGVTIHRNSGEPDDPTEPLVQRISVLGGVYNGNTNYGVFVNARQVALVGVMAGRNGLDGIRVAETAVDVDLIGCHVAGNSTTGAAVRDGIYIAGDRVKVWGGSSVGSDPDGAVNDAGVTAGTKTQRYGLRVAATASGCMVSGLTVRDNVTGSYSDLSTDLFLFNLISDGAVPPAISLPNNKRLYGRTAAGAQVSMAYITTGGGLNFGDAAAVTSILGSTLNLFPKVLAVGEVEIDGALNHDGTTVGFYGATPVAKAASPGTASGTDAAVINAVVTALRNLGLVT